MDHYYFASKFLPWIGLLIPSPEQPPCWLRSLFHNLFEISSVLEPKSQFWKDYTRLQTLTNCFIVPALYALRPQGSAMNDDFLTGSASIK